nr:unnamed protein product [Spirometra erinaceieuropaei]
MPHPDQHLFRPSDARGGDLGAPSIAKLAPAGLCSRPEARRAGRAGDKGDPLLPTDGPTMASSSPTNLIAEKNRLYKEYVNRFTDENKAAFYRSRCLVQQRLRQMQEVWTANKAEDLDLPPSLHETIKTVQQLSSGKAADSDATPAEIYKHGGP